MKQSRILISLSISLLLFAALLIFYLHRQGSQTVLADFRRDQLSYARHLSNQIRFYLQARSRGLRALSSFSSFQRGDIRQQKKDIQTYATRLEEVYVKAVSFYDQKGKLVYSTALHPVDTTERWEGFFGKTEGKTFLTPLFPAARSLTFTMAVPIFKKNPGVSRGRELLLGVLTFTLDMKGFLANQVRFEDPPRDLDQIWIVDKDGTLLFQPDHPDMVFRNIYRSDGNCEKCHASFNYVEEMLRKKLGTLDYKIKDHPKKIAAFASMEFENASWVVVVNTPYSKVTGVIQRSLRDHLLLLGVIIVAFTTSSLLINRNERMKIKAEEEVRRWQERMEVQRKAEEELQLERNKLKAILDSMNDGVYVVNQTHEILYTNPVLEKELGPIAGRKCHEYLFGTEKECPWCNDELVFAGRTVHWEGRSSHNGRIYDIFNTPFVGPAGELCKLGIRRDITEKKKAEASLRESEGQLRHLSSQLLRAQETERKRISQELHDELGQALLVMKLRLNYLEENLLPDQKKIREECQQGVQYIDQVIEEIRRLSRDLSPSILEDFGLSAAIRWLVNNFAKRYDIKVTLEITDVDSLLPLPSHIVIYRALQEALTNIGKHSRAKHVEVAVRKDGQRVSFVITDDGIGFDKEILNKGPGIGFGLETMRGRCQMVGGKLDICTKKGEGTRITMIFPIEGGDRRPCPDTQ